MNGKLHTILGSNLKNKLMLEALSLRAFLLYAYFMKKFKDYYGTECANFLAPKIKSVYKNFNTAEFIDFIKVNTRKKEFFERLDIYVLAFDKFLPNKYESKINIFKKILGPKLETTKGMFIYGWFLWPISRYIEKNALLDHKLSLNFIYELTQRFTGEFAIRPILKTFPKETLPILINWSKDSSVHVRRCASEGIRIRLPWANKINLYENHFYSCFKILNNLKNDSEKFVQKSVGNNLNDLSKENLIQFNSIIKKWQAEKNISKNTAWIIKHGFRTLNKK
jgi:3-methyladenine DNA glycosylase AlkC